MKRLKVGDKVWVEITHNGKPHKIEEDEIKWKGKACFKLKKNNGRKFTYYGSMIYDRTYLTSPFSFKVHFTNPINS